MSSRADLQEKSKGILNIGSHCHQCQQVDFLPFRCDICKHEFCQSHRTPESHGCERPNPTPSSSSRPSPAPVGRPAASAVSRPPASTTASASSASHSPSPAPASKAQPTVSKPSHAIERLKQIWSQRRRKFASEKTSQTKNKHVLMAELKRGAKGDPPSTPQQKRIYLYLERPPQQYNDPITNKTEIRPSKKVQVYFDKSILVGRLLDRACNHLDVTNKNSSSTQDRKGLYKLDEFLPYNVKLEDVLQDGDTLVLK